MLSLAKSARTTCATKSRWRPICSRFFTRHRAIPESEKGPVRVRYAPSPTGFIHLGGLRTALFNYLLVRRHGGQLILRIEDTDRSRHVAEAEHAMEEVLTWAGIHFDESPTVGGPFGPYVQSERLHIYKEHAERLIDMGHAYRCFCTAEELAANRKLSATRTGGESQSEEARGIYTRKCLRRPEVEVSALLAQGTPHTIRMKVPSGKTTVHDLVYGMVSFENKTIDDQILLKADGFPTYHLAVVVDDYLMRVTHVLRGEEWLPSTPKHVILYGMFGWQAPHIGHLPLLLRPDRSKLSKRFKDAFVDYYRGMGFVPPALMQFVAGLGWTAPDETKEIWMVNELAEKVGTTPQFSLDRVHRAGAVVDEAKLRHINRLHMHRICSHGLDTARNKELAACVVTLRGSVQVAAVEPAQGTLHDEYLVKVIDAMKERVSVVNEIPKAAPYFWFAPNLTSDEATTWRSKIWDDRIAVVLRDTVAAHQGEFTHSAVDGAMNEVAKQCGVKSAAIMQLMRYCICGQKMGSGVAQTAEVLGQQAVLTRLEAAIAHDKETA